MAPKGRVAYSVLLCVVCCAVLMLIWFAGGWKALAVTFLMAMGMHLFDRLIISADRILRR